jgi:rod shape-determining protein MreB
MFDFFSLFSTNLGIDLGTANTLIFAGGKGIVLRQPSVVARQKKTKKVLAVGEKAKKMVGKTPALIEVVKPIRDGVIADFDATLAMLSDFFKEVQEFEKYPFKIFKPKVAVGISSGVTEVERKAVHDVVLAAGASKVFLIEEPLAAAVGIGLPVEEAAGILLVDIGGGTTEIAVISMGGIVVGRCLRVAGEEMDDAIANFLRLKYSLLLGEATVEEVKIQLGSAVALPSGKEERQMVVRGRDLESGLPKSVKVNSVEVREAISPILQEIISQISEVIEEMPPELVNDIVSRGIVLSGGGAQIRGLDKLIAEETKMPVWVADEPMTCVVRGCGKIFENEALLRRLRIDDGLK